ncbi:Betaine-aldehyde dehydrogenase [Delftia sp. Cs1-4]|uniref:aldehyde dehydrogenase family protein n=1 Tax=Delftia sp. (strain Cs1-4) TaxID=742013 RepID=UPI00020E7D14|nr:aldehyde dehydrogenase family protein [Delftia sp. Cs1-4]AEF88652.1 Betaine-aldehyde dehydrogenase [Delftia sp. Cs1-4]
MSDASEHDLSARVPSVLPRERGLYWGGRWHAPATARSASTINPSTGATLGEFLLGGEAEADAAVQAARAALPAWSRTAPLERARRLREAARRLREHSADLALIDAADCGNPVRAMLMDAELAAAQLEYFAGLVLELKGETLPTANGSLNYTVREPVGVVVRICAFNHPFMFAAGKIAAPLAAGNTVIVKPPEQAPLSTIRLFELLDGIFPPGVLNCVSGDRETGAALASHPDVAAVGIIGSVAAGKAVLRASADTMKRTVLELGGKNAMIIHPDADFDAAVDGAVRGMNFTWCGQSCGSTSRLFLHESLHDRFVDALLARLHAAHRPGLATDMRTTMGALVNRAQYDRTLHYVDVGRADGATLAAGGRHPDDPALANGFFVEPTVFVDVTPSMRIAQEEIFGPVLSVLRWRDEDALFDAVNGVPYGLTGSIWTRDLQTAHRNAARLQAGYVWVNDCSAHILGAPFGGIKQSGLGREESKDELFEFTHVKNVNLNVKLHG